MLFVRERPLVPAGLLPAPAPLPSLRDAIQRRAAIFGPFDADPVLTGPRGAWQALGDVVGRVVDLLLPRGTR